MTAELEKTLGRDVVLALFQVLQRLPGVLLCLAKGVASDEGEVRIVRRPRQDRNADLLVEHARFVAEGDLAMARQVEHRGRQRVARGATVEDERAAGWCQIGR